MAILVDRFQLNLEIVCIVATLVRVYWFLFPYRRSANEKVVRCLDVTTVMAVTMAAGDWAGGWAFYTGLSIVLLMYWSERRRSNGTVNQKIPEKGPIF